MRKRSIKRRGREEWEKIIGRQEGSKQTVSEYCREQNLSEKSFYAWRNRIGKNTVPRLKGFVEVSSSAGNHRKMLQIKTPGGYHLEVPEGIDGKTIKTIISALASP